MPFGRVALTVVFLLGSWPVGRILLGPPLRAAATPQRSASASAQNAGIEPAATYQAVLQQYCINCHNQRLRTGGLALDTVDLANPHANPEVFEKVITKLRARSMPPSGSPRPDAASYDAVAAWLEADIDRAWAANPNPGRTNAVHRLNRSEYNNAIRDLFAVDVDVRSLLPAASTTSPMCSRFRRRSWNATCRSRVR
jgi:mono/diheme cytochrome c family protein